MASRLYHEDDEGIRTRKILDGGRATDDNEPCCCGEDPGDPDVPDWVDPDGPGGPGGPVGPTDPDGDPRCCSGDTICSANDDEPLELGIRITGTIANNYTYGSGSNAGTPFSYSENFNEVFTYTSTTGACNFSRSPSFTVPVLYRERNGGADVSRNITIQAVSVNWDRNRGFFGSNSDSGDDPTTNISSGINLQIADIRGTNALSYGFNLRICRSSTPLLDLVTRPDTFRLSQPPGTTLDSGTRKPTTPQLACLNRVISEYDETFAVSSGGDTNSIRILYRFYAILRRVAPCEPPI